MTPRLLDEKALAEYLSLPIASVRRLAVGRRLVDGRVRFDRQAIDRWLDATPAGALPSPANANLSPAEDALARWIEDPDHAARPA